MTMEERFDLRCCFILVLLTGLGLRTACAGPMSSSPTASILDKINVCKTVEFMKESSYLDECKNIIYPSSTPESFGSENENLVFCMMVVDIATKFCVHDSTVHFTETDGNRLKLPNTTKEFDALLDTFKPKDYEAFRDNLCENITSLFIQLQDYKSNQDVEPYIKRISEDILSPTECKYTCRKKDKKRNLEVNKFCMIFFWANNVFITAKPKITENNDRDIPTVSKSPSPVDNVETKKDNVKKNKNDDLQTSLNKNIDSKDNKEKPITDVIKVLPDASVPENANKPSVSGTKTSTKPNSQYESAVDVGDEQAEQVVGPIVKPIKPDEEKQNKDEIQLASNDKTKDSKAPDTVVQNNNEVPPEDENREDHISGEDQNKKNNDNEAEDINEPDNNGKESINNLEEKNLSNDQEQFNLPQDTRKYFSPVGTGEDESNSFVYFIIVTICCILLYLGFHNKQKILAMALEGRRSRGSRRSRRRPSTASYRKLDSNLEEAVTSQCNSNVTHVIY